jgi:hypothetical protein
MARIAYVDHSYHQKTRSTLFVPETLARRGHEVDIFWDEAWICGEPILWERVANHDVVIMFQSYCPNDGRNFRSLHSNVVYIPMFDQFGFSESPARNLSAFWEPFQGSKVLSFSTPIDTLATGFGIVSHLVHYYPEVPPAPCRASEGLHGFLWLRREREIDWGVVRGLIGPRRFDSFHLHVGGDPGFPPVRLPPREEMKAHNITTSTWFDRRSDFDEVVCRANVYFAPRLAEGIGQTFLEAMSRGQCVVAADNPTMNEYIVHAVNGLLYNPRSPVPLDLSDVARLGEEARRGVIAGRASWKETEDRLVEFILTPSPFLYDDQSQTPAVSTGSEAAHDGEGRASIVPHGVRSVSRALRTAVRKRSTE